jgi:hypothetical protein
VIEAIQYAALSAKLFQRLHLQFALESDEMQDVLGIRRCSISSHFQVFGHRVRQKYL